MKLNAAFVCILSALSLSPQVQASPFEIELQSGIGFDDNPFRLSNNFSPEDESYWLNDIEIAFKPNDSLSFDIGMRDINYFNNDDASSRLIDGRVKYSYDLSSCRCTLEASVSYRDFDKTYISRFTGQRFTFRGQDASDRYDYSQIRPELKFNYEINKKHSLMTSFRYNDRDYEDYSQLGLSNLDYSEYRLFGQWQYKPNNVSRYQLFAEVQKREYDERLAVNANGDDIVGRISEYDYWKMGLKTRFKLARGHWLYANINYQDRADNGEGYFDTNTTQLYLRYFGRFDNQITLDLSVRYNDLDYPRSDFTQNIENQDETPSSKGWTYRALLQKKLSFTDTPLFAYISADYNDISADLAAYQYDRTRLTVGIKVEF